MIRFTIPEESRVRLEVFSMLGQKVATLVDEEKSAGSYEAEWKGGVASGVYLYRLETVAASNPNRHFSETKRMTLLK